jgi:hypothetical protein
MSGGQGGPLLLALGVVVAIGGCAFTDVTLSRPAVGSVVAPQRRGEGRDIVVVRPFANRPRGRCGMKKNGYNMDTANVHCGFDPGDVLADVVARELAAAGFAVHGDRGKAGTSPLVLTGVVEQMFVEPKVNYFTTSFEADVALAVTVTTPGGLAARRSFYVKGEEATVFASEEDMQAAVNSAVRQLAIKVVGAVANLVERLPSEPAAPPAPPEEDATRAQAP